MSLWEQRLCWSHTFYIVMGEGCDPEKVQCQETAVAIVFSKSQRLIY